MAQGNPNKVNAIVDEIVENNNVFKLKSPIEQDKEKDSIAQSINSALSVLNEVGKELVLQELSVDPDEKFKGFIDSVGNVDISGLSQMTATIVKEKIIEAEKEGIDLRQGQPAFKDNTRALLVEGVLTLAAVDVMVKNFKELSAQDRQLLIKNWDLLSSPQISSITKSMAELMKEYAEKASSHEEKEFSENMASVLGQDSTDLTDLSSLTDSQIEELYKDKIAFINGFKAFAETFNQNKPQASLREILEEHLRTQSKKDVQVSEKITDKELSDKKRKEALNYSSDRIKETKRLEYAKDENFLSRVGYSRESLRNLPTSEYDTLIENYEREQSRSSFQTPENADVPVEESTEKTLKDKISQEIEQLPNKLIKEGFSQEEISEAMKMYSAMIQSIPLEEYEGMNSSEKIIEFFKSGMEPPENKSDEILFIIAQNDFGGHLQEILTSPELLQEKFLPTLENEIQKLDEKQITDTELEKAKNTEKIREEFLDASGAIELQKQQESTKLDSQNIPTTPEEHIQESVTRPEQEIPEETSQNMSMVEQDNSFIGKIKRVFANMIDMKNKDNSKGFFARLGASIQTVFGKKDEYSENQDKAKEQINNGNSSKTEQPISFDEQLRQGIDQNKFNQPNIPKGTIKEEKDSLNKDDDYEQK